MNKDAFKYALKNCFPVILGYLAAGFAFGLMFTSAGFHFIFAIIMSAVIYTGAGQYLAVDMFSANFSFFQMFIMTFLINSKHLFYGLSLLEDFKLTGKKRPYMVFSLTDETYAVLTTTTPPENIDKAKYMFYVAVINHISWISGSSLGAIFGSVVKFNTTGLDFAMTALFFVLLIEQLKTFKSRLPFIIGGLSAFVSMFILGKSNMLLGGAILSVIFLLIFRKRIEEN